MTDAHEPCSTCGDTGLIHGPGQNGNWTDDPCGCPAGTGDEPTPHWVEWKAAHPEVFGG